MKNRGDFLYYFQLFGALVFGTSQIVHMWNVSTQGVATSTYMFTLAFVAINTYLAIASDRLLQTKTSKQIVVIYVMGCIVYGLFVLTLCIKSHNAWTIADTVTSAIVGILIAITSVVASLKQLSFKDPVVKGIYGLWFRFVPHLALAWKIETEGGQGINVVAVVVFHILTLTRIVQIFINYKTEWNRNKTGLAIAEIGNELSWIIVTIVWLMK